MKEFTYYAPTEILFGCGKVAEIGNVTKRYGKRALLVTGSSKSTEVIAEKALRFLQEAGVIHSNDPSLGYVGCGDYIIPKRGGHCFFIFKKRYNP